MSEFSPGRFLPYGRQTLDEEDKRAILEVLETDFITQGPNVIAFEEAIAKQVGARYAVACSSGTAALHLACLALGLKQGQKLVTSPITFLSSANCAHFCQADSDFVDIDPDTWCLSPEKLEEKLEREKVDVVVPVHFSGHPSRMREIRALSEKYEFKIIEDCCHAPGAKYEGSPVGNCEFSDLSMFSFHPVKHITSGEGGCITTNSEELWKRLTRARTHGMHKDSHQFQNRELGFDANGEVNPWYYEMEEIGFNYRITDIQCALGISQLKKLAKFIKRRREIADFYSNVFANLEHVKTPVEAEDVLHAYHLYTLRINFEALGKSRRQIMKELSERGIGTQVLYIPLHFQPYYKQRYGYQRGDFPNAEQYYSECLSIPMFSGLSDQEMRYISENVIEILEQA